MESVLYTRIKELCENRGISMTKLSEDLGIAASLIRKWKTTTSPSVDKVKMIAEYMILIYLCKTFTISINITCYFRYRARG